MNERERIVDLMKKGILSTEEGLDLLENSISKETQKTENEEFTSENNGQEEKQREETVTSEEQKEAEETLEELIKEINQYSVELDKVNDELTKTSQALKEKNEQLNQMTVSRESTGEKKQSILDEIHHIQKELELIKQLDEVDNTNEIIALRDKIDKLSEKLDEVEMSEDETADNERAGELRKEKAQLENKKEELSKNKQELMKQLNRTKMKQWTLRAKQATENFEIPEDWKKEANEEFSKAGKKLGAAGKEISSLFKKTVQQASDSDVKQTVRSSFENALDNFDWKNISVKFPALATKDFSKEWTFEDSTATIIDLKVANGKIAVNKSQDDTIRMSARGKLYGRMDEETPEKSFDARSTITADDEKLLFHVPNKRVYVDFTLSLPEKTYDYLAVNMLNGKLDITDLSVKDIFAKSTNGSLSFDRLNATMLEAKGSNGSITVKESKLKDLLASTVNGSVAFKGKVESGDVSTTNGEVKLTLRNSNLIRFNASTVNGNVKMAIPDNVAFEGEVKTTFGKAKSRLSNIETADKTDHVKSIKRVNGDSPFEFNVSTTTGNILLKDTDK